MANVATIEQPGPAEPGCPKRMVQGPCGGVRPDGRCEMVDDPCPFLGRGVVRWGGPRPEPASHELALGPAPWIVIDLRVRPFDRESIRAVTARLAPHADALLVGEHHVRPDFPPTMMSELVRQAGGRPWVTLTCRDRNRVVLESELAGLSVAGALGVHCVTGDGRARSVRTDATQVFDLDGTRLAALATAVGLDASVAESPAAPPVDDRPGRLLEKQRSGARLCFVNHAGGVVPMATFVRDARAIGVDIPLVPCVPVITDEASLAVLERFPGLVVDPHVRRAVMGAGDGRRAGIAAAVESAIAMLSIDGVSGVNLSGSATAGPELESAAIMADVAAAIRDRLVSAPPASP